MTSSGHLDNRFHRRTYRTSRRGDRTVSVMRSKYVPWDEPWEWVAWLVLLIIATFIIHNGLRMYKEAGRPHP